jgi:hypothetical protein
VRVKGQHSPYLMFVCDEAEGIADYVPGAIDSMASGGIAVVILLANPRTRLSWFYRWRELSTVRNFRMSCLAHPNVVQGREVVPGAVRRDYVEGMIEAHCEAVPEHREDDHTFEVPWRPGAIYRPDAEFLFRVLGIAPANLADDTFLPVGRYEAAVARGKAELESTKDTKGHEEGNRWKSVRGSSPASGRVGGEIGERTERATMGIDAAGYGADLGTLYVRHGALVWRAGVMSKPGGDQDPSDYWRKTRTEALRLHTLGVRRLHIRIDAGGGFGNGVYDRLKGDGELMERFTDFQIQRVHFSGTPHDSQAYADLGTEMYAEAAESMGGLAILTPPPTLEGDLCGRRYVWVNRSGVEVKRLEEKRQFRKRQGRSPDDGDGFVLCVAPDFLFIEPENVINRRHTSGRRYA